jgi:MFS family permease
MAGKILPTAANIDGGTASQQPSPELPWWWRWRRGSEVKQATNSDAEDQDIIRIVAWRVLPMSVLLYLVAVVDRSTIGFAKLQMVSELGLTEAAFGLGSSLFFIGSIVFEVPSAFGLTRWGPRRWLSRILLTWSIVTLAMAFCRSAPMFYLLRFLLGVAEAGAYPGLIYYLSRWFPQSRRVWAVGLVTLGSPIGNTLAAMSGGMLLGADGHLGLADWQWIFVVTGCVSALLAIAMFIYLPNEPRDATFLSPRQKVRLHALIGEPPSTAIHHPAGALRALFNLDVAIYAVLFAAILTSSYGIVYWLPTVVKSFGATSIQNGFINAVPWSLSTLMLIVLPRYLHDERSVFRAMIAASAVCLVCFGVSTMVTENWQRFAALVIGMPCMSVLPPCFWWLPSKTFGGRSSASTFAAITTVGSLGGVLAQSLMPVVAQAAGRPIAAMLVPAAALTLVLATLVWLRGKRASEAA